MNAGKHSIHEQKQQAARLLQCNRADDARKVLTGVCSSDKKDAEAWYMLGAANSMLGLYPEAEKCMRHVVKLAPGNHQARNNLGSALRAQGKFREALSQFDKAVRINPDYAVAHFSRGGVLQELGNIDDAIASYQQAARLAPHDSDIHHSLAEALRETGNLDSALQHYQQALCIKPGWVSVVVRLADIYKTKKQYAEAFHVLEPYVQAEPGKISIDAAMSFALLCRHTGRYDAGIELLERIRVGARDTLLKKDQAELCFGLGNLHDARGNYKDAFYNFENGNQLRSVPGSDEYSSAEGLRATKAVFTPQFLGRAPRASNTSESPVFIVGMPRSGTSLVEQILCSHPAIYGAGELSLLDVAVDELRQTVGSVLLYPDCLQDVKQVHLDKVANNYLAKLKKLSTGIEMRITDKMPANYWHLGLIYLLFPGARVIHCVRNPLDTCLSIYFQDFANAHNYTNDLKSIGRVYSNYTKLMDYWQRVLEYPVLEIHYEDLVKSHEIVSRRLVEFCGLPWDEQCLKFQDNPRMVMTASHDQVRRAIYKTSVHRWKNYQTFVGPLLAELGDVLENADSFVEPLE